MRDCQAQRDKITLLRGLNDAKDQQLGELDAEINTMSIAAREQDAEIIQLQYAKHPYHNCVMPMTGRFIKRTEPML